MIFYGIPSFRRSTQLKTLAYLQTCGIPKDRIIVSVQDNIDLEKYAEAKIDTFCNLISCTGDCVSDNRNNILTYCEDKGIKRLIMLDDDISRIHILCGEGNSRKQHNVGTDIDNIMNRLFGYCEKRQAKLFGGYPVSNEMMQSQKIRDRWIFIGTLMGFTDMSLRFDRDMRVKEDYELCLRLISQGQKSVRFDFVSCSALHKSRGGCSNEWDTGQSEIASRTLIKKYPILVKQNPKRKGEILFNNVFK